jgi:WhiB family redox-sensing transcriptional regulator
VGITAYQWMTRAACRHMDPELFFPSPGQDGRAARAVCAACPVRRPCLAYALAAPDVVGIWAGTTRLERAELCLRRTHAAPSTPT